MKEQKLYERWDKQWEGAEKGEPLTRLGRRMFKAKNKLLAKVLKELEVKTAIEVGCGLGYTTQILHGSGLDYTAIDVSPHAVAACRKKGLKAEEKKLEDETRTFDLVLSDGLLEHFIDFTPYAKYLMRISRKYVLLLQPNHDSFWGRTLAYLSETLRGDKNILEYNYRITDFISVFQDHGFALEKNLPVFHDVFRLLLFKKGN